jgi:hypothetical protein
VVDAGWRGEGAGLVRVALADALAFRISMCHVEQAKGVCAGRLYVDRPVHPVPSSGAQRTWGQQGGKTGRAAGISARRTSSPAHTHTRPVPTTGTQQTWGQQGGKTGRAAGISARRTSSPADVRGAVGVDTARAEVLAGRHHDHSPRASRD